jgi:hypothetical protein
MRPGLEVLEGRLAPATLTVNSLADNDNLQDTVLTLREAIDIVNHTTMPAVSNQITAQIKDFPLHNNFLDTIKFDASVQGHTITLGGSPLELSLSSALATIKILGESGVTVDGNSTTRVFQVDAPAQASFDHLTVVNGHSPTDGGGIYNSGGLTLSSSAVLNCSAGGSGGGIFNSGPQTVNVTSDTIQGCTAIYGGGISNQGTLIATSTGLYYNSASSWGGGVANFNQLTLSSCAVSGCSSAIAAGGDGGGIYNSGSLLQVSYSTFSSNQAGRGGGISNVSGGQAMLSTSTISGSSANSGGGIYNQGTMVVSASTLSSDSATAAGSNGGGIDNAGNLTVKNSTLSSCSATVNGGGIYSDANGTEQVVCATLSNCTASQGGGIFHANPGNLLSLKNSIVAGNHGGNGANSGPDIHGGVAVVGQAASTFNLVGIGDGSLSGISNGVSGNQIGTSASPIDPKLAPLGYYGGYNQTYALLVGSPAINQGDPNDLNTTDQRSVYRSGAVNIGAYQATANHFVFTNVPASVSAGQIFSVTLVAEDPWGQTAVGYTGTANFSSSKPGADIVPPPQAFVLASGGQITVNVTLGASGVDTLSALDSATGVTGSTTVQVN